MKIIKHLCQSSLAVTIDKYIMQKLDIISEELFNKIRGRFPSVTIGDSDGNVTNEPSLARFFDFDYMRDGNAYGKVSISLDEKEIAVVYSQDLIGEDDALAKNDWYSFLKELRQFARKRMLNFDTRDINKSNLNRRDYKFLATNRPEEENMNESKMYGTSRQSYQDIGNARLLVKHSKPVNTELAAGRTQHVEAIYIESADGERFKYPYRHLNGARAMARHVSEGGKPYDDFGKHISSLSEELGNLRKFKTYMGRSSVMAESLSEYMGVVLERLETIKKTVQNLQKESFYKETVESFEVPVYEDVPDDVKSNWIDELTIKQFNEELQDVFPYIYKLVGEATKAKELTAEDLVDEGERHGNDSMYDKCWDGYKKVPGKKRGEKGSCVKEEGELEELFNQTLGQFSEAANDCDETCPKSCPDCGGTGDPEKYKAMKKESEGRDEFDELISTANEIADEAGLEGDINYEETDKAREMFEAGDIKGAAEFLVKSITGIKDNKETAKEIYAHLVKGMESLGEGNAYAHAVRKAKMDGKKKGDKVQGPDGDEITLEKEGKTPIGEFILSYFDRETGQFPKGETAILTMVEKDYGEEFIEPAKAFIEQVNNLVSERFGYKEAEEEYSDLDRIKGLAGL
jgi:hypothetical protein